MRDRVAQPSRLDALATRVFGVQLHLDRDRVPLLDQVLKPDIAQGTVRGLSHWMV
jgi:hypothetical protein